MPVPSFLRRGREAPRVEHPFVLAQVRQEAQLFRERVDAGESAAAFFCTAEKWRSVACVASAGLANSELEDGPMIRQSRPVIGRVAACV